MKSWAKYKYSGFILMLAGLSLVVTADVAISSESMKDNKIAVVTHAGNSGGTDVTTRMMMLRARGELDKEMFVENRKGGGGEAAMRYYQSLPPNGQAILAFTSSHAIAIARGKADVKIKDFRPIARATNDPQILMVKCGTYKNAQEFIDKQKEISLTYGVSHLGNIDDISAYAFTKKAGLKKPRMLPFDGGGTLSAELGKGGIDVGVLNLAEADSEVRSGKVCPLIVLAEERMANLSNVPTATELGIPVSFSTIRGFVVHASTPPEISMKIEKALLKSMKHPIYQGFLDSIGLDASSVVGSRVWGNQMKKTVTEMQVIMKELNLVN